MTPRVEKKDWFAELMQARLLLGENVLARFGRVNTLSGDVTWHDIDHVNHDGLGMFVTLLRDQGHRIEQLPGNHKPEPGSGKWAIWRDYWAHVQNLQTHWKQPLLDKRRPHVEMAWHVFSVAETQQIDALARQAKVSTNIWLLATLNPLVAEAFVRPGTSYRWLVPVNLRGALQLPRDTGNHVSAVSLSAHEHSTPRELHQGLRDLFKRQHDWAYFWTIRFLARWLGKKTLARISRDMMNKSQIMGCLSNLGAWQHSDPTRPANPDEAWVSVPINDRGAPVAAGSITWNGRLSIALELNAALGVSFDTTQRLLDAWKRALLSGAVPSSAAETTIMADSAAFEADLDRMHRDLSQALGGQGDGGDDVADRTTGKAP